MTTNPTNKAHDRVADADEDHRYAELNIGDEEFVIYDREDHQAWIQSTVAVGVEDLR